MAEVYDVTEEGGESLDAVVKIVVALLIGLAVFVGGWWLLQGPSARLAPAMSAREGQQNGSPEAVPGSSGQQGGTGTNSSP